MKIEILGKFYDNHSLAIVNRNILIQLSQNDNLSIAITPTDVYNPEYKIDKEVVKLLKKHQNVEFDFPDIQLRHCYPPVWRWPTSEKTKIIYIQPWEWSRFPMEWQYKFETFSDALIVPSEWESNVILDGGINPNKIFVVPNGYDPSLFNIQEDEDEEESDLLAKNKKYVFVFVGNGQFRKGIDLVINAWKDCFKVADNCQLFIKDSPQVYGQTSIFQQIMALQYNTGCGTIVYNDDCLSEREMAKIYKKAFAIVAPYRGEGFGMHIQEATACGAIPIITRGGPTDEFISDEISVKIATGRKMENLMADHIFAGKPGDALTLMSTHGYVLDPDFDELKKQMKNLYHHHEKQNIISRVKSAKLENTWENVGNRYLGVFDTILSKNDKPSRMNYV